MITSALSLVAEVIQITMNKITMIQ